VEDDRSSSILPLSTRFDPEDLREIVGAYHRCVADTVGRSERSSPLTRRWRRQSAANPSRKWSSESRVFGGPTANGAFPQAGYLSDCYYAYFSNSGIAAAADFVVYQTLSPSGRPI
jgi:hypothetical protein